MAVHEQTHPVNEHVSIRPQFSLRGEMAEVPRLRLPDGEMPPDVAAQIIHDELMLDGNARLNLATFVTTWMEPAARTLMTECFDKNMIDKDEYPQTAELEKRCVSILADLWHAPSGGEDAVGCSTTGSSQAAMLRGMALTGRWAASEGAVPGEMALKRRWAASGRGTGAPNLVMGANVQVCWEKFCRYWDVEARLVDVGPDPAITGMTPERAAAA